MHWLLIMKAPAVCCVSWLQMCRLQQPPRPGQAVEVYFEESWFYTTVTEVTATATDHQLTVSLPSTEGAPVPLKNVRNVLVWDPITNSWQCAEGGLDDPATAATAAGGGKTRGKKSSESPCARLVPLGGGGGGAAVALGGRARKRQRSVVAQDDSDYLNDDDHDDISGGDDGVKDAGVGGDSDSEFELGKSDATAESEDDMSEGDSSLQDDDSDDDDDDVMDDVKSPSGAQGALTSDEVQLFHCMPVWLT